MDGARCAVPVKWRRPFPVPRAPHPPFLPDGERGRDCSEPLRTRALNGLLPRIGTAHRRRLPIAKASGRDCCGLRENLARGERVRGRRLGGGVCCCFWWGRGQGGGGA